MARGEFCVFENGPYRRSIVRRVFSATNSLFIRRVCCIRILEGFIRVRKQCIQISYNSFGILNVFLYALSQLWHATLTGRSGMFAASARISATLLTSSAVSVPLLYSRMLKYYFMQNHRSVTSAFLPEPSPRFLGSPLPAIYLLSQL